MMLRVQVPGYPNDADGDALRRVVAHGADMSLPMLVDFMVAATSEAGAVAIGEAASSMGYATTIERDTDVDGKDQDTWTVYCSRTMRLDYASVVAAQAELDNASAPFGGHSDGWGTFGNLDPAERSKGNGEM